MLVFAETYQYENRIISSSQQQWSIFEKLFEINFHQWKINEKFDMKIIVSRFNEFRFNWSNE